MGGGEFEAVHWKTDCHDAASVCARVVAVLHSAQFDSEQMSLYKRRRWHRNNVIRIGYTYKTSGVDCTLDVVLECAARRKTWRRRRTVTLSMCPVFYDVGLEGDEATRVAIDTFGEFVKDFGRAWDGLSAASDSAS